MQEPKKIPLISVDGDAYNRGKQCGTLTKHQIAISLKNYREIFALCNISWDEAILKSKKSLEVVSEIFPDIIAELKGLAAGSNESFESLFALNARTEILPANFLVNVSGNENSINECTSLALNREENPVWLAQNWDWIGFQRPAMITLKAIDEAGNSYITVTEAGMLAKIGLNSHGFGISLNILRSHSDGENAGIPVHLMLRALLNCKNTQEAIELVGRLNFTSSSNILIADKNAHISSMELSPIGVQFLPAQNGHICHTNHFLHPTLEANDAGREGNISTQLRLNTAKKHLPSTNSFEQIKHLLSDTSDGLESICRFPDTSLPKVAQLETVLGVIMNVSTQELWVSDAQPSITEFTHHNLQAEPLTV